jgi:hypothetical protein
LKYYFGILLAGLREYHEKYKSRQSVTRPRSGHACCGLSSSSGWKTLSADMEASFEHIE